MGEQVAARFIWGCSSVGRAPALQAGGHEFESHHLHLVSLIIKKELEKPFDSKENQNRKQRKGEATDWYIENCILNIE